MRGFLLLAVVLLAWLVGLITFAHKTGQLTPAPEPRPADAIVALTGASDARLSAAIGLLNRGKGRRVLITGVDRKVKPAELAAVLGQPKRIFACCVDLGFQAANTMGNATETATWAKAHHVKSLIVVTADYHMPRSLVELHARMPGVRLIPYAIPTPVTDPKRWWRGSIEGPRLALEYCKYLVIRGREFVLSLGGPDPEQAGKHA